MKGYSFNKNSLRNNNKLKIPKCKLSLEIENKRKTNNKSKILSPKLKNVNINIEQIKKKENTKMAIKKDRKRFEKK